MVPSDGLCTFPQCSGSLPYVFFIAIYFSTLETVDGIAFPVLGVLILWSDQQLLNGGTSLEICLYPISAADLLEAFSQSLYIGYHYEAHAGLTFVGPDFCISRVVRSLCWVIFLVVSVVPFSSQLLLMYLFCSSFIAHLGYLHFARASLRCSNPSLRRSHMVHTVLALWVRVPMTLYLAARLWFLSHCKYWSVWVGLQ